MKALNGMEQVQSGWDNKDAGGGGGMSGPNSPYFYGKWFEVGVTRWAKLGTQTDVTFIPRAGFKDEIRAAFEGVREKEFRSDEECLTAFTPAQIFEIFERMREIGAEQGKQSLAQDIRRLLRI